MDRVITAKGFYAPPFAQTGCSVRRQLCQMASETVEAIEEDEEKRAEEAADIARVISDPFGNVTLPRLPPVRARDARRAFENRVTVIGSEGGNSRNWCSGLLSTSVSSPSTATLNRTL